MLKSLIKITPVFLLNQFENFLLSNYQRSLHYLNTVDPDLLEEISKKKALRVFRNAAKRTPAYKKFLHRKKVKVNSIKSISDFDSKVPATEKDNYVRKYKMLDRCLDGKLPKHGNIDESGGTSGVATNWIHDFSEQALLFKAVDFEFNYIFRGNSKNYLVLSAWSSGPWATGVKFCELMERVALVKNTTTDAKDIIKTLKMFGTNKNYLIGGYPPFIKNLIDDTTGLDWKEYNIDLVTGGEGVTLDWVYHVRKRLKSNAKIISSYGASDIDIGIGFETPLAFAIREAIAQNKELRDDLFDSEDVPMVFQYNPTMHYISERKGRGNVPEFDVTLLDEKTIVPKVKYNLHDQGKKFGFNQLIDHVHKHNPHFMQRFIGSSSERKGEVLHLPFLLIFGRTDGTISFDGANVYPRQIQEAFFNNIELTQKVNRFKFEKKFDRHHNPIFFVHVELKKKYTCNSSLRVTCQNVILNELLEVNPDFKESYTKNKKLKPVVKLYGFDHPLFKKDDLKVKNIYIIKK